MEHEIWNSTSSRHDLQNNLLGTSNSHEFRMLYHVLDTGLGRLLPLPERVMR
jgi:predicted kinase